MELMKITDAKIISSDKRARVSGGLYITFTSFENLVKDDYLKMKFESKWHNFQVTDVEIEGANLKVTAKEVGYWARFFDNQDNFDLRKIIGTELTIVTDEEEKKQINLESCWC